MKNTKKIITTLIDMAIEHYQDNLTPDVYAAAAAFVFAKTVALEHSASAADAAALVAALDSTESIIKLTHWLAKSAIADTALRHEMKTWRRIPEVHAQPAPDTQPLTLFFQHAFDNTHIRAIRQTTHEQYQSIGAEGELSSNRAALHAARAHYTQVFSSAHSSYRYAIEMAARYSATSDRLTEFTKAITTRLSAELNHQPMEPSFAMAILCSTAVSIIGWALLLTGVLVLALGIAGLTWPVASGMLMKAGLGLSVLTTSGAGLTAAGTGVLTCQFFARQQWARGNEASRLAADAFQDEVEPEDTLSSYSDVS